MTQTFKSLVLAASVSLLAVAAPDVASSFGAELRADAMQDQAAAKKRKTRKVPAMSQKGHKQLQQAQEAMEEKDFVKAEEELNEMVSSDRLNDYEKAVAWQLKASIAFERDDTPASITAFEQILKYRESIPEALELQILFNLSQLYYTQDNYDRALTYVKEWESRASVVSIQQKVYISQLYYQREEYENSLTYIYDSIADAQAVDTIEVQENWYSIALSAHWELNQYDEVRKVLETLIVYWPKPTYWTQLAGIYGELGRENDSFSITEAAYKMGFLDENETQLVNLAQILIAREAPIKAAWVMTNAFEENLIENTPENQRLLGQAYLQASEWEMAVAPMKAAADGLDDGYLWFQTAQIEGSLERYKDSVESYDNAIRLMKAEKKKSNHSRILAAAVNKATALIELKEFTAARAALKDAESVAENRRERSQVRGFVKYMEAEKAREDLLAEAGISD